MLLPHTISTMTMAMAMVSLMSCSNGTISE